MRTAEEIIKWAFDNTPMYCEICYVYEVAVKEAMKEAIKECSEKAKYFPDYTLNSKENDRSEQELRQQLLLLIDQIK